MRDVASRHAVNSIADTEHRSASVRNMKLFGVLCALVALSCGGSDAFPIEGEYSISSGSCSVFSQANPSGHRVSLGGAVVEIGPPSSSSRRPEGCDTRVWMYNTGTASYVEAQFCVGVEDPPGWWTLTPPFESLEFAAVQMDDDVVKFRSTDVSMSRLVDRPELAIEAQGMDIENEVPARLSCVLSLTEL